MELIWVGFVVIAYLKETLFSVDFDKEIDWNFQKYWEMSLETFKSLIATFLRFSSRIFFFKDSFGLTSAIITDKVQLDNGPSHSRG